MGRVVRRVEGPWGRLLDAMKLLELGEEEFRRVVDVVFDARPGEEEKVQGELEIGEMDLAEMKGIVRLRQDCWR